MSATLLLQNRGMCTGDKLFTQLKPYLEWCRQCQSQLHFTPQHQQRHGTMSHIWLCHKRMLHFLRDCNTKAASLAWQHALNTDAVP